MTFFFNILCNIFLIHDLFFLSYNTNLFHIHFLFIIHQILLQFFVGWWFIIDAHAKYPADMVTAYHVCGIFGTISLFM